MPQILKPSKSGVGGKLQSIAPIVSMIPGVGPVLGAAAGIAGGLVSKKDNTTVPSVAISESGKSDNVMQRRLDADMLKLQDSIQIAKQMPEPIRQQTQPHLESAYQAMIRRSGGTHA